MLYIVMTAKARMPANCWGSYGRIAVVKTDGENMPKQINPQHKAVIEIVELWDKLNIGKTSKSAFYVALAEANDLCNRLNSKIGESK